MNGTRPSSQPTPMGARWSNEGRTARRSRLAWRRLRAFATAPLLLLLAMNLTGCAATSPPLPPEARNPAMPPATQDQPSEPYSISASARIKAWRKLLTDTLAIP